MSDEQTSLSVDTKTCPKCGATWIGGQHYWSGTGKLGNELDLAGLVCNNLRRRNLHKPLRWYGRWSNMGQEIVPVRRR